MRKQFERAFEDAVADSRATAGRALLWKLIAAALVELRKDLEVDVSVSEFTADSADGPVTIRAIEFSDVLDVVDRHIRRAEHEEALAALDV